MQLDHRVDFCFGWISVLFKTDRLIYWKAIKSNDFIFDHVCSLRRNIWTIGERYNFLISIVDWNIELLER